MAEIVLRSLVGLLRLIPDVVGFLMLRKTLRGEESFKDTDRRFLFGRSRDEVLIAAFWLKVGLGGQANPRNSGWTR